MNAIAAMYNNGRGVAKDHAEGNFWLTQAAEMGNADAKRWLGHNLHSGLGAVPDHAKAGRLYREAAEAGHTGAMRALAPMYDWGQGGLAPAPDPVTASRWALKALQGGDDEPFNAFWMLGSGSRASGFTPAFRREMQLRLQEAGVYNGPTDGTFSGETDAAIEAFHHK
jgi:TPR repeat protein